MGSPSADTRDPPGGDEREPGRSARFRVLASMGLGACVAVVVALLARVPLAPLAGWDVTALVFVGWTWREIWGRDARSTARLAVREDPTRAAADLLLLVAAVSSLLAVGLVIVTANNGGGAGQVLQVGLGVFSVVLSWAVVHTIYALRYARMYYSMNDGSENGGIDFNEDGPPQYSDFAYVSFTIGMTFQVSDTSLRTKAIRATALRHALLSYLFGTVIVAMTINLVAGLSR
ncbi:MAG TPA: DUF1345 domain-containing protein [Mycobacteriales bacterium]|nr:DUF1345 domain-containing protein [Mycobacteriales bacterium]